MAYPFAQAAGRSGLDDEGGRFIPRPGPGCNLNACGRREDLQFLLRIAREHPQGLGSFAIIVERCNFLSFLPMKAPSVEPLCNLTSTIGSCTPHPSSAPFAIPDQASARDGSGMTDVSTDRPRDRPASTRRQTDPLLPHGTRGCKLPVLVCASFSGAPGRRLRRSLRRFEPI